MIKILQYIYQFLYYSSKNRFNLISFFPFFSVVSGTVIILLTISVMDSIEDVIINKMDSFNFTYSGKLTQEPFVDSGFDIYNGNSKKYLIFKGDNYRIINIKSINNFDQFKNKYIGEFLLEKSEQPGILIGMGLAKDLNLKAGEKAYLASPLDINLITGIMPVDSNVNISGIFNYDIMDYDHNYAFLSNQLALKVLPANNDKIFLKSNNGNLPSNQDILKYKLLSFRDENSEFIKAMNTEKLIYSIFGYVVILIASASSISLMFLFIVRKKKQLSILKTLGFKRKMISKILIFNSLIVSFAGVTVGFLIYLVIVLLNFKYHFIQNTFFSNLPFNFEIDFSFVYFIQILLISSILMVLGSLYPIVKILKINLSTSLRE